MNPAVTLTSCGSARSSRAMRCSTSRRSSSAERSASCWSRGLLGDAFTRPAGAATSRPCPAPAAASVAFVAEARDLARAHARGAHGLEHRRASRASPGSWPECLVAAYITFEAPLSGMSMNPARSFAPPRRGAHVAEPLDLFHRAAARNARWRAARTWPFIGRATSAAPSSFTPDTNAASTAATNRAWERVRHEKRISTPSSSAPAPAARPRRIGWFEPACASRCWRRASHLPTRRQHARYPARRPRRASS